VNSRKVWLYTGLSGLDYIKFIRWSLLQMDRKYCKWAKWKSTHWIRCGNSMAIVLLAKSILL